MRARLSSPNSVGFLSGFRSARRPPEANFWLPRLARLRGLLSAIAWAAGQHEVERVVVPAPASRLHVIERRIAVVLGEPLAAIGAAPLVAGVYLVEVLAVGSARLAGAFACAALPTAPPVRVDPDVCVLGVRVAVLAMGLFALVCPAADVRPLAANRRRPLTLAREASLAHSAVRAALQPSIAFGIGVPSQAMGLHVISPP